MKKLTLSMVVSVLFFAAYAERPTVKIESVPSPNLLVNPGFEEVKGENQVAGWTFSDMADSGRIKSGTRQDGAIGQFSGFIETPGNLPGYWCQNKPIEVKEGITYFGSAKVRAKGPRVLLWISTDQWHDGKNSLFAPWSSTTIFAYADSSRSSEAMEELGLFISPELVQGIGDKDFHTLKMEFTVPEGHNVHNYNVRVGAYFGTAGWIMIDDVYFGEAKRQVKMDVSGKNLKEITILNADGSHVKTFPLKSEAANQQIALELPSTKNYYQYLITAVDGTEYREEF